MAANGWAAAREATKASFTRSSFTTSELCEPNGRVVFPKGFGAPGALHSASSKQAPVPHYVELDERTRNTWEYPSSDDFPDREYQFEIASVALFQNTLVALPTGLGKTFIAAVVMYNYYRLV